MRFLIFIQPTAFAIQLRQEKRASATTATKNPKITIAIGVHSPLLNEGNVFMLILSTYTPCCTHMQQQQQQQLLPVVSDIRLYAK